METLKFEDYLAISRLAFEWADSYDKKDWNRLCDVLAPNLTVDYSIVGHQYFPHMKSEEFIAMMSSPDFLADPLVHTQHLLGAARYEWVSETEIDVNFQIRSAHQRYTSLDHTKVAYRGHSYGAVKHSYKMIDRDWKLAGIRPEMYWTEHDFDKIFPGLSTE